MKIQCMLLCLTVFVAVAYSENETVVRAPERRNLTSVRFSRLEDLNSENQNDMNNSSRRLHPHHPHFVHNADWHRRHGIPLRNARPAVPPVVQPPPVIPPVLPLVVQPDETLNVRIGDDDVVASSTLAANITSEECLTKYQQEQDNLKVVLAFYDEAFGQHDVKAVDKYISPDYIQHNPHVADGQKPLVDFLVPFNAIKTKGPVDIRHTAVNGDIVWLHVKTTGSNGEPLAIVDIFRVKDGKIIEHWDVIQEIPALKDSKNPHPMF